MGYRSDVAIFMNKAAVILFMQALKAAHEDLQKEVIEELQYADGMFGGENGDLVIRWESVKWYSERVGITFIEQTVNRIGEEADEAIGEDQPEVVMVRVGDDYDDVEHYESSTSCNPYDIRVRRELICDLGKLDYIDRKTFLSKLKPEEKEGE